MAETTQAPRTEAEREAMVAEEAVRLCASAGGSQVLRAKDFPCAPHRERANAAIPPVSPDPALVSAEEWSRAYGQLIPRELVDRLLATLRHYEAEVGRLEEECRVRALSKYEAIQEADKALAREAPFAALGRAVARLAQECKGTHFEGVKWTTDHPAVAAAVAALAEEQEPQWSEPAPSGNRYRMRGGKVEARRSWMAPEVRFEPDAIPLSDAAFVAKLMESKGVTP